MSPIVLSCIIFVCVLCGALLGVVLRNMLPGHHLSSDAKDVIRLGRPRRDDICACPWPLDRLVEGHVLYTQNAQIKHMTSNIILLDQLLAQYGAETATMRQLVRKNVDAIADRIWGEANPTAAKGAPFQASDAAEAFYRMLQELSPQSDSQRSLQSRAIQISTELAQTRLLLFAQRENSIPMPFLVVLIFWITILFTSFSLFAEPNPIIIGSLVIFALSATGAIFRSLNWVSRSQDLCRYQVRHYAAPSRL